MDTLAVAEHILSITCSRCIKTSRTHLTALLYLEQRDPRKSSPNWWTIGYSPWYKVCHLSSDTTHFLQTVENWKRSYEPLPPKALIVTLDVVGLYSNIPHYGMATSLSGRTWLKRTSLRGGYIPHWSDLTQTYLITGWLHPSLVGLDSNVPHYGVATSLTETLASRYHLDIQAAPTHMMLEIVKHILNNNVFKFDRDIFSFVVVDFFLGEGNSNVHTYGPFNLPPQWGAMDAEIKVPSGENTRA